MFCKEINRSFRRLIKPISLVWLASLLLAGCHANNSAFPQFAQENWASQLNCDPGRWICGANSWFLTGKPNQLEEASMCASPRAVITNITINATDFSNIISDGDYQVQIVGGQLHNSITLFGPNLGTRMVSVDTDDDKLILRKIVHKDDQPALRNCSQSVIVRIGVRELHSICHSGCGNIYGRGINSSGLSVTSTGRGHIMFAGDMNVHQIRQCGQGTITLIGAVTPCIDINTYGCGSVNIYGRVGIRNLTHYGEGEVNIIGADSDNLSILAVGKGLTTIVGSVNLQSVIGLAGSQVYVSSVHACGTSVRSSGTSRIGLAGDTQNLDVDLNDFAFFEGKNFLTSEALVHTTSCSHANISILNKLYVKADKNSSIYLFKSPKAISQFLSGNAVILPM